MTPERLVSPEGALEDLDLAHDTDTLTLSEYHRVKGVDFLVDYSVPRPVNHPPSVLPTSTGSTILTIVSRKPVGGLSGLVHMLLACVDEESPNISSRRLQLNWNLLGTS